MKTKLTYDEIFKRHVEKFGYTTVKAEGGIHDPYLEHLDHPRSLLDHGWITEAEYEKTIKE